MAWTQSGNIRGASGVPGATGATGPTGPAGPTGASGPAGSDATVTSTNIATALGYTPLSLSTVDAKGDLLVGTANDTVGRLAVGADDTVLRADSAQTTGTKWTHALAPYSLTGTSWCGGASGEYVVFGGANTVIASTSALEARLIFTPYWAPNPVSITRIAIQVITTAGSAGSVVRIGAYNDDNGIPGSLIFDAGTVDSTTTGNKEITTNQTLPAGRFWLAAVVQGGASTVATLGGINQNGPWNRNAMIATQNGYLDSVYFALYRSSVTGSLPNPAFSSRSSASGTNVGFAFRVRLA